MNYSKGDKGYCYMPYEYLTNKRLCFDLWTVRQIANDNFSNDNWDCEDIIDYYAMTMNPEAADDDEADDETVEKVVEDGDQLDEETLENDDTDEQ